MKTNYYNNICPRCKENKLSDEGFNALSRRDNKTEICSPCGTAEAFEDYSREEKLTPTKDIEPDEEITVDYKLQPDLEQPGQWTIK